MFLQVGMGPSAPFTILKKFPQTNFPSKENIKNIPVFIHPKTIKIMDIIFLCIFISYKISLSLVFPFLV